MAAMVVVNGPIRHEIGMNSGTGAMAPYNHANATIGRAYGLLSQNLQGGSLPGDSYMGSQGNGYAYGNVTFAENEERSPWEPFHVQHGFKPTDSTVSVFTGCRSTAFTLGVREKYWREHVRNMLRGMDAHSAPTFLLDPIAARQFIDRGGFDTKEKLIEWVYENALMPAGEYWDYQLIQNYIYPRATFGEEPYASKLKAAPDEMIRCSSPTKFMWSWSAAKPTATGASWAATIRRPSRWMSGDDGKTWFKTFKTVQPLRSVQSPTSFLPRVAGEDEGGGLIGLNGLNVLNGIQRSELDMADYDVIIIGSGLGGLTAGLVRRAPRSLHINIGIEYPRRPFDQH